MLICLIFLIFKNPKKLKRSKRQQAKIISAENILKVNYFYQV